MPRDRFIQRFIDRLSRPPGASNYLWAVGLAGVAALCRVVLRQAWPGVACSDLVLVSVALTGALWGTRPAILALGIGFLTELPAMAQSWLANGSPVGLAVQVLSCAAVLGLIALLRRAAGGAAAAEARLAEVFRQIPASAAIIEAPDGSRLMRSDQSDQVIGDPTVPMDHWRELDTYGGVHPDGRKFAAEEYPIVRALRTGEVVSGERFPYRRPDGVLVDLEVHAGPVRDGAGRVVAAVGMAFDVTDRVRAERDLQDSELRCRAAAERLRVAIDAGALGLWECDLQGRHFRLDARTAAMLGLPCSSLDLTRAELALLVDPAGLAGDTGPGAASTDPGGREVRVATRQGDLRWLVTRGIALPDEDKIIGVAVDVTERHRREAALEDALRARDVLMHEADHRIKNSLQLVASLLRLQLSRVPDQDARDALADAIGRVDAVANAHLALQRSADLKTVELDSMLQDLCRYVGTLNPAVSVRCKANSGLALDAEQAIPLGLIASELLTNALRHAYAPEQPGEVLLLTRLGPAALDLVIRDGGVGLPPAPVRSGLGSTVIATLARQIGAALTASSRPGEGTEIILHLPLLADEAADAWNVASTQPAFSAE
jgi:two-component sensor histidine kinase/PAS domain-containing protein